MTSAAKSVLSHLTLHEVAGAVEKVIVPRLAEACLVRLRDGAGAATLVNESTPEARRTLSSVDIDVDSTRTPTVHAGPPCVVAVPLHIPDTITCIGHLVVISRSPDEARAHVPTLVALAEWCAIALTNAVRFEAERRARTSAEHFVEVAAHDLKAPLTIVNVAAHHAVRALLRRTGPADGIDGDIASVRRAATRMARLIDDLLDVARVRAGRLVVDRTMHRITSLLEESRELALPAAADKDVRILIDVRPRDASVPCDRERILQVVTNLLTNALKFAIKDNTIVLRGRVTEKEVTISVEDDGPGIPAEDVPFVFERFWQGTHGRGGTGLGLAISHELVRAHGGRIWAEAQRPSGVIFRFTLPSQPPPEPIAPPSWVGAQSAHRHQ